jgi:hypothetical protein
MNPQNIAQRESNAEASLHPAACGPCDDCIDFIWTPGKPTERIKAEYARRELAAAESKHLATIDASHPTLEQFKTHARKFGPDCVVETARDRLSPAQLAELELEIATLGSGNGKPAGTRQRRTTDDLAGQVLALRDRGVMPAAIADTLNLSDRRVANILSRSRPSRNGAEKRLVQAKLFAA